MRYDLKEWLEWKGEEVLREVGIRMSQTVLDFKNKIWLMKANPLEKKYVVSY